MNSSISVCLIHGHGVDASIWESIYADLVSDYRVLIPNLKNQLPRMAAPDYLNSYADEWIMWFKNLLTTE